MGFQLFHDGGPYHIETSPCHRNYYIISQKLSNQFLYDRNLYHERVKIADLKYFATFKGKKRLRLFFFLQTWQISDSHRHLRKSLVPVIAFRSVCFIQDKNLFFFPSNVLIAISFFHVFTCAVNLSNPGAIETVLHRYLTPSLYVH